MIIAGLVTIANHSKAAQVDINVSFNVLAVLFLTTATFSCVYLSAVLPDRLFSDAFKQSFYGLQKEKLPTSVAQ